MKINGEKHYLWRAVDHEGEVLEAFATKTRNKAAALKFLKEDDEAPRKAQGHRHRQATLLRRCDEGGRQRRCPGDGSLAEQPRRELPPTVPTTRAGHAAVSKDAHPPEIQFSPCLRPQPFQPRTPPRQPRYLQRTTLRRIGGVAGSYGLGPGPVWDFCAHRRQVPIRLTAPCGGLSCVRGC